MQFFHYEIVILHDTDVALLGMSVFLPPLPKAGRDTTIPVTSSSALASVENLRSELLRTDFLYQLALGIQRRRVGAALLQKLQQIDDRIWSSAPAPDKNTTTTNNNSKNENERAVLAVGDDTDDVEYVAMVHQCKGLMPHPSTFKHDFRVLKGQNAMNPALARALLHYLQPLAGDVLLDPLCGSGTLLLEAWLMLHGDVVVLGGDASLEECVCCAANLESDALGEGLRAHGLAPARSDDQVTDDHHADDFCRVVKFVGSSPRFDPLRPLVREELRASLSAEWPARTAPASDDVKPPLTRITTTPSKTTTSATVANVAGGVFQWNASRIPLQNGSVDCIVSDLPFGRRCGNHRSNSKLYPSLLSEFARVLRAAGTPETPPKERKTRNSSPCCALLTIERRVLLEALDQQRFFRLAMAPVCVDMGGLCPYIFVLSRAQP
jgi:hypothetical protein